MKKDIRIFETRAMNIYYFSEDVMTLRGFERTYLLPIAFVVVWTAAVVAWVWVIDSAIPVPRLPLPDTKVSRLCDEQVEQVLTTTDPVELQRAIFLVGWFNCAVGRRLP
jgi:hypothetical protein